MQVHLRDRIGLREMHFLQNLLHVAFITGAEESDRAARKPEELHAQNERVAPTFQFQETQAARKKESGRQCKNGGSKRAVQAVSKEDDGKRHVEQGKRKGKEKGKDEKPADNRDGKWAAGPLRRLRLIRRRFSGKLRTDAGPGEQGQPPDTYDQGDAVGEVHKDLEMRRRL